MSYARYFSVLRKSTIGFQGTKVVIFLVKTLNLSHLIKDVFLFLIHILYLLKIYSLVYYIILIHTHGYSLLDVIHFYGQDKSKSNFF